MLTSLRSYTPKKWNLSGLTGISDGTLEMHFGLYEGYVKNVNLLNERLGEIRADGKAAGVIRVTPSSCVASASSTTACACTSTTSTT